MEQNVQQDFAKCMHSRASTNACDQCSRRKIACSKEVPRCQRCADDGRMCTYSVHRSVGRPRKASKHNIHHFKSPETDFGLVLPNSDSATQATTPRSKNLSCSTPLFSELSDSQFFDLDYRADQDGVANDYPQSPRHGNEESNHTASQSLDWMCTSPTRFSDNRNPPIGCNCVKSLLQSLQTMTPSTHFNDATKIVSYETVSQIRSSFSACERLISCPHVHQSACIMLLLAVVQHLDDILYRMTAVFREECKAAMRTQDFMNGGNSASFLGRSDLMRGVLVLAAANSMDQTEYGVEKDSLRPIGTLQEYIIKLQSNFEARILELF